MGRFINCSFGIVTYPLLLQGEMSEWTHGTHGNEKYRVRQKYLTIWQHSCDWNRWRGEFVLEHPSSETQSISVAMERWSVEHRTSLWRRISKTTILSL